MKKTALILATCALLLATFNVVSAVGGFTAKWACEGGSPSDTLGPCEESCSGTASGDSCQLDCDGKGVYMDCSPFGGLSYCGCES